MATAATNDSNARALLTVNASGGQNTITWSASVTDNSPNFGGFGDSGASWSVTAGPYTLASASNQSYDFGANSPARYFPRSESGTVTGVPAGTYTVSGTFSTTGLVGTATIAPFNITVSNPSPPATPVWSTGTTLTAATRGTAYSRTVTASPVTSYSLVSQSGGTGTYSVSSGGVISGTPSAVGTANVTVRANNSGSTADRTFTFTVNPALPVFTDSAVASPTIRGNAYSNGVTATEAASYSVFSGSLPAGISLNTSSGAITGTPTTVGTSTFVIRATNVTGSTNTPSRTIVVNPRTPVFSDSSVNSSARVGTPYSDAVAASEVDSYSIFSGDLPLGLSLNTSTGAITGSPTTFGTYTFIIRATNVTGNTNTATLTITVTSGSKVWNGTTFVVGNTKAWNGTTFVSTTTKVWNGSAWVSST